jgi:DNA-binding transcriptional ArsR family regulator
MRKRRQLTPSMHQPLASLLFPEYRRRVLGLLLLRPEEALHGREVARRTGLPAGTITRELTKLAEAGLLRREKRGNQQVYSANTSGPIFAELASILRKTSAMADGSDASNRSEGSDGP